MTVAEKTCVKRTTPELYAWDREQMPSGGFLCGVDEAGRGPLAGDVYAAAAILDPAKPMIEGLNDSKKLSEKKREALFDVVRDSCLAYCVATATVAEIETYNILGATMLAMQGGKTNCRIIFPVRQSCAASGTRQRMIRFNVIWSGSDVFRSPSGINLTPKGADFQMLLYHTTLPKKMQVFF